MPVKPSRGAGRLTRRSRCRRPRGRWARRSAPAQPRGRPLGSAAEHGQPGAYVNQDFPDFPDYSSFLADDFVNPNPWSISTIFVPGDGWNGFSTLFNATALTWQIYADNAGVPAGDPSGGGNPPVWTLTLPPTDPQVVISTGTPGGYPSNTTLNLAAPLTLPAGHWWLVFYPTLNFGAYGQYGRQPADTTNGYVGQFINPGGGFGYGTVWQDWTVLGPTQHGHRLPPGGDRRQAARLCPDRDLGPDQPAPGRLGGHRRRGDRRARPGGVDRRADRAGDHHPDQVVPRRAVHLDRDHCCGRSCGWIEVELEQRPVVIHKLPPVLWIDAVGGGPVWAGQQVSFTLLYGNTGGFENDVMIRNDFPPGAPFAALCPAADRLGSGRPVGRVVHRRPAAGRSRVAST